MTSIDAKEAAAALSDIASIAHRVRQSTTYNLVVNGGGLLLGGLWMRRS